MSNREIKLYGLLVFFSAACVKPNYIDITILNKIAIQGKGPDGK